MEALSSGFIVAALSFSMTLNLIHKDNDGLTWTLVKSLKIKGRILFSSHIQYMPILKYMLIHCVLSINL